MSMLMEARQKNWFLCFEELQRARHGWDMQRSLRRRKRLYPCFSEHLSLCQRNYEQVRLLHLIVVAVPVPQIEEQIVDVINVISQEQMSKRIGEQSVDDQGSFLNAFLCGAFDRRRVVVRLYRHRRLHGWMCLQLPSAYFDSTRENSPCFVT